MGKIDQDYDVLCSDDASTINKSSLVSRNVTILGRRTSIRLEPEMWVALRDIAAREECSIHDVCTLVYVRKKEETSFTAAIRVFLMLYFKAAATEIGHRDAGHGDFSNMMRRARVSEEHAIHFKYKKKSSPSAYRESYNDNLAG